MPILNWLTRDSDIGAAKRVPYRLLEEATELSAGDPDAGNMLIQGDNLEALKALLPFYAGQVKCIYIDPPYNTRSAFEHYDDNLEHTQWLAMMWPRLALLRELLAEDGVFLMSLNDDEAHYAKVICDEIFGRKSFICSLVWNYEGNTDNQAKIINYHEHIFVYSKSGKIADTNVLDPNLGENSKLFRDEIRNTIVKNGPKNPPSQVLLPVGFPCAFEEGGLGKRGSEWPKFSAQVECRSFKLLRAVDVTSGWSAKNILLSFIANGFQPVLDSKGQQTRFELTRTGAIEAVKERQQTKGHFVSVLRGFGTTNQMRITLEQIGIRFTFPKPVGLIAYLVQAFSKGNDLVLDSFAGSGTTGHATMEANARDQGNRRYILIERNEQTCETITRKRMCAAIDGALNVNIPVRGGGFRFYRLGPPVFDEEGHIRSDIRFSVLAAHIWFSETNTPWTAKRGTPLLGFHEGRAFALLYNGILGDKCVDGGNVLTRATLALIREKIAKKDPAFAGPLTVYGEQSRITAPTLDRESVTFKQTPYDVKARR